MDRVQRRDLQPRRRPRRARGRRSPLQDPLRHRNDRPCLRGVGRRLRRPPARHVRIRDLGCAASPPAARTGSAWREAAVLGDVGWPTAVRIRDQVNPEERADPGGGERGCAAGTARDPLPVRPGDALQGHPSPAARSDADFRERRGLGSRSTGTSRLDASPTRSPGHPTARSWRGSGSCSKSPSASA